jgi:phage shock protein PspC (stress-responsive transcriptional regulator)
MADTRSSEAPIQGVRLLRRHREGRLLAGVATGLARYLQVDLWVLRLGLIALVLAWGFGIVLYLLAWLFVPVEGEHQATGERLLRGVATGPPAVRVLALLFAGVLTLAAMAEVWPAALLAIVGVAVLLTRRPVS